MDDGYKNSGQVGAMGEGAISHDNTFIQTIIHQPAPITYTSLHQLPPPSADFVGREKEMVELLQALESGGITISGLQGMGGIGKTALALKLAEQLKPKYPDAQFYLDLRGTSKEPLTTAQAMAHIIRSYHPEAKLPDDENGMRGLYLSLLNDKKALLLMDNAANAEQVNPLIPPAGSIMLVTSRNHFTRSSFFVKNLDALEPKNAEQLLLKIAPRTGDYAAKIAELCGYLPLALEVAASAVHKAINLAPDEYVKRLSKVTKRLELVEASLVLSYELLSDELKKFWRVLSVFPNSFDDAAVASLWELDIENTQDTLADLISYSLIEWNETTRRYRLHDLVQVFTSAQLKKTERLAADKVHATYFLNLLAQTDELYIKGGEEAIRGLALFDLERENIEAGQRWAASLIEKDNAATLLSESYYYAGLAVLDLRLNPREKKSWLEMTIKAAHILKDKGSEGAALSNLGEAYQGLGEYQKALEYYEQSLLIAREYGDRKSEGMVYGAIGGVYSELGEHQKALEFSERFMEIANETGDRRCECIAHYTLANTYNRLGEYQKALEYYEQSLLIAREISDRRSEGQAILGLGVAYYNLDGPRKAIGYYEQSLKIACEIGDLAGQGFALYHSAFIYNVLGARAKANLLAEQALALFERIESPAASNVRSLLEILKMNKRSMFILKIFVFLHYLKRLFT